MKGTLDKLVRAIQAERNRRGSESRQVFLDFDSDLTADTGFQYGLTAPEASDFLRSEKNREILRQRLGAESVALGYRVTLGVGYSPSGSSTTHAAKKSGRQRSKRRRNARVSGASAFR